MNISSKDLERLRALAAEQSELAHSPAMDALRADWEKHGRFAADSRPMVTMELWTFAEDILPPLMQCEGEDARRLERMLLSNIVNHTLFHDDTIVRDYLPISPSTSFTAFGLPPKVEHSDGLGHHFVPQIEDLEAEFDKLKASEFSVDVASAQRRADELNELFGDILPARVSGAALSCSPMGDIVRIMAMDNMYVAMYDYPELFHKMLGQLADDYCAFFDLMERSGAIMPTLGDTHLNQGTYCFTDELSDTARTTRDVWGYIDSQETSGVSPRMYAELVFPHYRTIIERYGLLSYGCCEATNGIWDSCLSTLPNLRKVSISPWCDEPFMGERLRGKRVVYLRKPTPNLLGVGDVLDEDEVRRHFSATVEAARGCTLEIAQRDVYRVSKSPEKVRRYVEIIRECLDKHQK